MKEVMQGEDDAIWMECTYTCVMYTWIHAQKGENAEMTANSEKERHAVPTSPSGIRDKTRTRRRTTSRRLLRMLCILSIKLCGKDHLSDNKIRLPISEV